MWKFILTIYTALTWGFISILTFAKHPHPDQVHVGRTHQLEKILNRKIASVPYAPPLKPIQIGKKKKKKKKDLDSQTEANTIVNEMPELSLYYRDSFTISREWLFVLRETFESNARKPDTDPTKSIIFDDLARGVLRSAPVSLTIMLISLILNNLLRAKQNVSQNTFVSQALRINRRRRSRPRVERRGTQREWSATA